MGGRRDRIRGGRGLTVRLAAALLSAVLVGGCWLPREIGGLRVDGAVANWPKALIVPQGEGGSIEVSIGGERGEELRMGPIYFALALSETLYGPGGSEGTMYRFGFRSRSSMLNKPTRSYPYAAVGVYAGFLELAAEPQGRLGLGVDGGYGVRIGIGSRAALDIELTVAYSYLAGGLEDLSWSYGLAFSVLWGETW